MFQGREPATPASLGGAGWTQGLRHSHILRQAVTPELRGRPWLAVCFQCLLLVSEVYLSLD